MIGAVDLARLGCATLFLTGLLTGVWKYRAMITSPDAQAPVYVDICHRAALMYAFACLVLAEFAGHSAWPATVNRAAVIIPIVFFIAAVASYAVHGLLRDTDNQLRRPHRLGAGHVHGRAVTAFMALLAAGEIGGFLVLLGGYARSLA